MISSYYGFWDYWNLYHKVTFDGINKLIIINDEVTELDVQQDIYSPWKEWVLLETNSRYLAAFQTIGGEPTVAGQRLDVTYFLINGWKLKPYSGTYSLNIIGNIFSSGGGDIKVPADINRFTPNNISINVNTSVIVRQVNAQGGSDVDLTEIENQLNTQSSQLVSIDNRLFNIENLFNSPIVATLEESQEDILLNMQQMLLELWKINGLDSNLQMTVNKNGRSVGDISQTFQTSGTSVIVTRNS